jgi:hypothetical protein
MILSVIAATLFIFVGIPLLTAALLWGLLKLVDYYLPLRDYDGDDEDQTDL